MPLTEENVFVASRQPQLDLSHEKSVGHLLINALESRNSDRILLVDHSSGRQWKGAELKEKILNIAAGLISVYKMQPGTVCLVRYPCSDWYTILALGIICAGGVQSTSSCDDPYNTVCEFGKKIEFKFLFCQASVAHWCSKLEKDVGSSITTILMDTDSNVVGNFLHLLNFDRNSLEQMLELPVACQDKKKDWAVIQITSGTTGTPKAAVFSHASLIAELSAVCSPRPQEVVLSNSMTLDYIAGKKIIFCGLYMGFKIILLPEHDIKTTLEVTEKYGVHMLYLSGVILYNLITNDKLADYNMESVNIICGFGNKLIFTDELGKFLKKHQHILYISISYGTTEMATVTRDNVASDEFPNTDHGGGTLECFNRARIVDLDTGMNLGKNKRGEIRLLNATMFLGYIDHRRCREPGSKEPIINDLKVFDEQGYYRTGDIGYFNDKEELFVEGRIKEVIKLDGWTVLPEVIEKTLLQQELIHSVCVIGIPNKNNPILGCARAFIKLKPNCCFSNSLVSSSNSSGPLQYKGKHGLCSLPEDQRRLISRVILENYESKVYSERRLLGGIVILDELKLLPRSGKVDKQYLSSLTIEQVEVYGDRNEC